MADLSSPVAAALLLAAALATAPPALAAPLPAHAAPAATAAAPLPAHAAPAATAAAPLPAHGGPAAKAAPAAVNKRQPVTLSAPPAGSSLEADARAAVATDLAEAGRAKDYPLLLVGTAQVGGPRDRPALFVQIQSARECGSAGCNTSVHIQRGATWQRVVDTVSGPIVVDGASHRGMRDLIVNGRDRWIWNGSAYANTRPSTPEPNFRRR